MMIIMKNIDKDKLLHPKPRKRTLLLLSHLFHAAQSFLQRSKEKKYMFWLKTNRKKEKKKKEKPENSKRIG